jgi:hypothetical protein
MFFSHKPGQAGKAKTAANFIRGIFRQIFVATEVVVSATDIGRSHLVAIDDKPTRVTINDAPYLVAIDDKPKRVIFK